MASRSSCFALVLAFTTLGGSAGAQVTFRASVSTAGAEGTLSSSGVALSSDGRVLAFTSSAPNLVPGDTNDALDVFVRDLVLGTTERVSVTSSEAQSEGGEYPALSANGLIVAFKSWAPDLVPGDTDVLSDVFVRDRVAGTTERVSVDSSGTAGNGDSAAITEPALSADGRFVAFASVASNLVAGDSNGAMDVFVHDRQTGATERVSVDASGTEGDDASGGGFRVALSADGRFVAFESLATNLVAGDTNNRSDIFVHDRQTGATERASVDSAGVEGDKFCRGAGISADGRFVVFLSNSTQLVGGDTNGVQDVFLHDRQSASTERVSVDSSGVEGDSYSSVDAVVSADGRFVAFSSYATNLVAGDTNVNYDVFLRDRQTGITELVSRSSTGVLGDDISTHPALSADARRIAFDSRATNLTSGDTNGYEDVFVRDLEPCSTGVASYCTAKTNSSGCTPAMSSSGAPSASTGSGFVLSAVQVLDLKPGLLLYSVHGPGGSPFQGGFLCATPPTRRTPLQTSSAAGSPPCTGVYGFDFNVRLASGVDPSLVVGQQVWSQFWTRDSGVASGTGLTDGLSFTICL